MMKTAAWLTTLIVVAVLVWQAATAGAIVPRAVAAGLLLGVGILAGLRLGADSAAAYIRDLQRLNKLMADQQQELEQVNSLLLKQVNTEAPEPSKQS